MNQRGLTLVEVLVALGIFAAVSAIGVGALGLAANGSRQLEEASERVGELERMRGLLRQDLYQLVDRPVIEPDTNAPRPPFLGGDAASELLDREDGEILFAMVRSGWTNPGAREPRAELQAVTYLVRGNEIIRRTRPFLDAARDTPFRDDVLIGNADDTRMEFFSAGRWRPEAGRAGEAGAVALRLSFDHAAYGPMEHVFLIGGPE